MKVVVLNFSDNTVDVIINVPEEKTKTTSMLNKFIRKLGYNSCSFQYMAIPDGEYEYGNVCECVNTGNRYNKIYVDKVFL